MFLTYTETAAKIKAGYWLCCILALSSWFCSGQNLHTPF